jgi:hypothetical protein
MPNFYALLKVARLGACIDVGYTKGCAAFIVSGQDNEATNVDQVDAL